MRMKGYQARSYERAWDECPQICSLPHKAKNAIFNNYPFVICCPTCFLPPTPPKKSLAPKCGWLGAWNVCVCCRLALMNEEPGINIENLGDVRWHLCLCLVLAWILVIIFVSRGIQSTGKVTSSGFKLEFSFFDRIILS